MRTLLFIILACLCFFRIQAVHWAVLVAGSNGYENYRHQANVFHAYQVLIRNGIKAENIITLAYDDIADDFLNPFPGKVYNKPAWDEGKDVYEGVNIDYKGKDVTPETFLSVIQGEKTKVFGRVLESTAEDNVFIYFAGHSASGLLKFLNKYLYADALIKALNNMHEKKMYKEMVIYIEASRSGSMFENILPANINIYATTSANSKDESYAAYCIPNESVNGIHIWACLGDLYSVNFLENLDKVNPAKETLKEQFDIIKKLTTLSDVQQFGDLSMAGETIGNFQGNGSSVEPTQLVLSEEDHLLKIRSAVSSIDVKLHYLQRKHEKENTLQSSAELMEEIKSIRKFDTVFNMLRSTLNINTNEDIGVINFECLKGRVAMYEAVCGKFSDYGLKYVRNIQQSCQQGVDDYKFEHALVDACYNYAL